MIDPSFPLVELHHHLDGSVRTQTIIDLCREHHLSLPALDVEALRPFTQVTDPQPDILAFFKKFQYQTMVMVTLPPAAALPTSRRRCCRETHRLPGTAFQPLVHG